MPRFEKTLHVPVPVRELFAWHARRGAVDRLVPPWEGVVVESFERGIEDGRVVFRMPAPLGFLRWVARHEDFVADRRFCDVQERGPFARWRHEHLFEPDGLAGSCLTDRIEYALPMGRVGALLGGRMVRRKLDRMFSFRHRRTAGDLERHAGRGAGATPLAVALTGTGGLVGRALAAFLSTGGHRVVRLVRRDARGPDEVRWEPREGVRDLKALEGLDAVVHLAGAGIADRRWSAARKAELVESRVGATERLARSFAHLAAPPKTWIGASAVGVYGDRGDEVLDESSALGTGFLADLGRAWEAASAAVTAVGTRVVHARLGVVVGAAGGALKRMRTPFRLGLGGPLGGGRQWVSWIALDDVLGAMLALLDAPTLHGPVVLSSPNPVTQRELAMTLGRVLHRPAFAPMPAAVARILFGEVADALLLSSQRARPTRLEASGFSFRLPRLEDALRFELGEAPAGSDGA